MSRVTHEGGREGRGEEEGREAVVERWGARIWMEGKWAGEPTVGGK